MPAPKLISVLLLSPAISLLTSCAVLYHVQVGDVEKKSASQRATPFDVKLSETGVDVEGGLKFAGAMTRKKGAKSNEKGPLDDAAAIWALMNMGPRTGMPVFTEKYAQNMIHEIYQKCPSGKITGLTSIRENRSYGYISGEIVKVTGTCLIDK